MAEKHIHKLKVDEDFKKLISPLSAEELHQLEQNIIRDGCREPLCIWNNTILDGHNRYAICTRENIPFTIQRINIKNHEEAIVWICANQLGRRNITEETRKYLIGKRYEVEKILGAHNAAGINQHTKNEVRAKMLPEPPYGITAGRTRERLAKEYNICHASVLKYERYSQALDVLSKTMPILVPRILSGETKISHENIVEMSLLSTQAARRLNQHLCKDPTGSIEYSDIRRMLPEKQSSTEQRPLSAPAGSIKEMPVYDPDSEISGLVFTISSWVSSIDRTRSAANLSGVTEEARIKLENELLKLKQTVDSMLTAIREVSNGRL